jgi:hypothetical protein
LLPPHVGNGQVPDNPSKFPKDNPEKLNLWLQFSDNFCGRADLKVLVSDNQGLPLAFVVR